MRRGVGGVLLVLLGIVIGYWVLRAAGYQRPVAESEAKRNVLAILDKTPASTPDVDNMLVRAAARIEPAVVNIDIVGERRTESYDIFGQPVEHYFTLQGKGSGVLISPDGYVVTNNHVIEGANVIRVTTVDGRRYDGRVVGADAQNDLAVVKIDGANLPAADLGDSTRLKVGEYVIAIGYPLGIGTTVTHGIISATDRRNLVVGDGRVLKQALQTDAPINRGNSGGALANTAGQLVGINTAIASENGGGNIGIGFAIPINSARSIIKELIASGGSAPPALSTQPYIGVQYYPIDQDIAEQLHRRPGQGVVIANVQPLSPAEEAGLKRGMVVVDVDGKPISGASDIRGAIGRHKVGDTIALRIVRGDGTQADIKVKLGRKPPMLTPG